MNLLITGIHGYVCTNLVNALKAQHTIYGLDIVSPHKVGVLRTFLWDELDVLPPIVVIHSRQNGMLKYSIRMQSARY